MSTISILVRKELSWTRSGLVPVTVLLSTCDTPGTHLLILKKSSLHAQSLLHDAYESMITWR